MNVYVTIHHLGTVSLVAAVCRFLHDKNRLLIFRKACLLFRYSAKCLTTHTMSDKDSTCLFVLSETLVWKPFLQGFVDMIP